VEEATIKLANKPLGDLSSRLATCVITSAPAVMTLLYAVFYLATGQPILIWPFAVSGCYYLFLHWCILQATPKACLFRIRIGSRDVGYDRLLLAGLMVCCVNCALWSAQLFGNLGKAITSVNLSLLLWASWLDVKHYEQREDGSE